LDNKQKVNSKVIYTIAASCLVRCCRTIVRTCYTGI